MPIRPLSEELQEIAIAELKENPDRLQDDLKIIRKWAETKKHIKLKEDDQWLVTFLRSCCFDLQLVKKKLELLYTIRPLAPEFFKNRDPLLPDMQELLKSGFCLPLPNTPGSIPFVLCRVECFDATKFRFEQGIKMISMLVDIALNDDNFVIKGAQLLVDTKGITLQHVLLLTPGTLRKGLKCFYEAYPVRPRGFHMLNAISLVHMAFNAFKYLLNNKLLSMIFFHGGDGTHKIRELVPNSALPRDYGGDGPSLAELTVQWKQKAEEYKDWFLEDEKYFASKPTSSERFEYEDDFRPLEGFFRKLEID